MGVRTAVQEEEGRIAVAEDHQDRMGFFGQKVGSKHLQYNLAVGQTL